MVVSLRWLMISDNETPPAKLMAEGVFPVTPEEKILPARLTIVTTAEIPTITAAAAAAISAKAAIAAAATAAIFAWLSFIHFQSTAVDFFAIELIDGSSGLFLGGHLDEAKASRTSRLTVLDDCGRFNRARLSKHFLKLFAGGLEGQISDIQFHRHLSFSFFPLWVERSCESDWLRRTVAVEGPVRML
jgi:hypothetical protein